MKGIIVFGGCLFVALALAAQTPSAPSSWRIFITNDTCPDYTWGLTEEETRRSLAELVRAHLDEMKRTDGEAPENRDRYNMTATIEALCFIERYPERKQELITRIKEGRIFVSPFLINSLWAFQSFESAVRTLYPARRLEKAWGIPIDTAEHIEYPALPWGTASILAGSGVKWLSVPFYAYDSTFKQLSNPPLFVYEGPDGAKLRVVMDAWASLKGHYAQGALLLRQKDLLQKEWLPHYEQLGSAYPVRAILASGTHSDISPKSAAQVRGFADAIIAANRQPGNQPRLVNAILPQFCKAVDEVELHQPFLKTVRGCFGHSWDLWPVSLAKYAAGMREGEHAFLAAEALVAAALSKRPELAEATRADRERAEWNWTMLADHAWNGTDAANKQVNAELRRGWSNELLRLGSDLEARGWAAAGLQRGGESVTLFNPLSTPRAGLVRLEAPPATGGLEGARSQFVEEDGKRVLYFVSPELPGFGFRSLRWRRNPARPRSARLRVTETEMESPFYRLRIDRRTGGIESLVQVVTGAELVVSGSGRTVGQTVYFDGQEHRLSGVRFEVVAAGPVLARVKITGTVAGIGVESFVTVYADLDQVDFDYRIHKPVTARQERLVQVFPVVRSGAVERIETTGAVIRPYRQPDGDLLPGADSHRFAVQGFVDVSSPGGPGVTIAPLEAFALRRDLDPITFEAFGNDQNYKEVVRDQHGITEFRFRYALQAHAGAYDGPKTFAFSRAVGIPLLAATGSIESGAGSVPLVTVDAKRAIVTAFKPAEDRGVILRLWEVAGRPGPLRVAVGRYRRAFQTDLLERNLRELRVVGGKVTLDLPAHGFAALRLLN